MVCTVVPIEETMPREIRTKEQAEKDGVCEALR